MFGGQPFHLKITQSARLSRTIATLLGRRATGLEIDLESYFFRRYKSPSRFQIRLRLAQRCAVAAEGLGRNEGFNRGSTQCADMDRRERLALGGTVCAAVRDGVCERPGGASKSNERSLEQFERFAVRSRRTTDAIAKFPFDEFPLDGEAARVAT